MDIGRYSLSPEAFGWLASSLTLATFICSDMRRLRFAALAANAAFIAYGALAQLWPVLVLHLLLVPVNLWRLAGALRADRPPLTSRARPRAARHAAHAKARHASRHSLRDPSARRTLH
jgi:hypothetical protein